MPRSNLEQPRNDGITRLMGVHAVLTALEHDSDNIVQLYIAESKKNQRIIGLAQAAEKRGLKVHYLNPDEIEQMAKGQNHQGVLAEYRQTAYWDDKQLLAHLKTLDHHPLILLLDGVTDPHNLGACLRSADAAGADAVICPKDKSAELTPVARKVASGAAERVPFVQVKNVARTLEQLKKQGLWVVGTSDQAEQNLYQQDLKSPTVLVMGAEGKGMRTLTMEHCDFLVSLPMAGAVSSLNVSVASGVCLFEAVRQRTLAD